MRCRGGTARRGRRRRGRLCAQARSGRGRSCPAPRAVAGLAETRASGPRRTARAGRSGAGGRGGGRRGDRPATRAAQARRRQASHARGVAPPAIYATRPPRPPRGSRRSASASITCSERTRRLPSTSAIVRATLKDALMAAGAEQPALVRLRRARARRADRAQRRWRSSSQSMRALVAPGRAGARRLALARRLHRRRAPAPRWCCRAAPQLVVRGPLEVDEDVQAIDQRSAQRRRWRARSASRAARSADRRGRSPQGHGLVAATSMKRAGWNARVRRPDDQRRVRPPAAGAAPRARRARTPTARRGTARRGGRAPPRPGGADWRRRPGRLRVIEWCGARNGRLANQPRAGAAAGERMDARHLDRLGAR